MDFAAVEWGDISIFGLLIAVLAYLWKQNMSLKAKNTSEMVGRIEASINNLSDTIKESTERHDSTFKEVWVHIGRLDRRLSTLIGQHEVNHKTKVDE